MSKAATNGRTALPQDRLKPDGDYRSIVPYLMYRIPTADTATQDAVPQRVRRPSKAKPNKYSARYQQLQQQQQQQQQQIGDSYASSTHDDNDQEEQHAYELEHEGYQQHAWLDSTDLSTSTTSRQDPSRRDAAGSIFSTTGEQSVALMDGTIQDGSMEQDLQEENLGQSDTALQREIAEKRKELGHKKGVAQTLKKKITSVLAPKKIDLEKQLPKPNTTETMRMECFDADTQSTAYYASSDALKYTLTDSIQDPGPFDRDEWSFSPRDAPQNPAEMAKTNTQFQSTDKSQLTTTRVRFHGTDQDEPIQISSIRIDHENTNTTPSHDLPPLESQRDGSTSAQGIHQTHPDEHEVPVISSRSLRMAIAQQEGGHSLRSNDDLEKLPEPPITDQNWWAGLRGKSSRHQESSVAEDTMSVSSFVSMQQEYFYDEVAKSCQLSIEFETKTSPIELVSDKYVHVLKRRLESGLDPQYVDSTFRKSLLRKAVEKSQLACFRMLLSYGAYKHEISDNGYHLIHSAAQTGNCQVIQILVDCGENPMARAVSCQSTPLHVASRHGRAEAVDLLLRLGAKCNSLDVEDNTPLHKCAISGNYARHLQCAKHLLEYGADVMAQNADGSTPIHLAASEGHSDLLRLFIRRPEAALIQDDNGMDAYQLAQAKGRISILSEFEAAIQEPPFLKLPQGQAEPRVRFFMSSYSVSAAAEANCERMFRLLENKKVEFELINLAVDVSRLHEMKAISGSIQLPQLVLDNIFVGGMEVMQLLEDDGLLDCLFSGVIRPESVKQWTQNKWAPLFICAKNNLVEVAEAIIGRGAPKDIQTQDTGDYPIHVAASNGNKKILDFFLRHGAQLEARNNNNETPLYLACVNGHLRLFRYLLRRGAKFQSLFEAKISPLHAAADKGFANICKILLQNGFGRYINTLCASTGMNPLHLASKKGFVDTVKVLIVAGGEPSALSKQGYTCLHYAIESGNIDVVDLLIRDEQAKQNERSSPKVVPSIISVGETPPINLAARLNRIAMIPLLLKLGGLMPSNHVCLIEAASRGHAQICAYLVAANPSLVQMPDDKGRLALHHACFAGHTDVVDALLKAGCNPNPISAKTVSSPLHLACRQGYASLVELLLKNGSDCTSLNGKSRTPLHEASNQAHLPVIQELVKHAIRNRIGFDDLGITKQDSFGATPLHLATANAQSLEGYKCVELLLIIGAPTTPLDKFGNTCYHLAADMGLRYTIELMLKVEMQPNIVNGDKMTPLHFAAKSGRESVVRLLLTCPDLLLSENADGKTAVQLAQDNGHQRVAALIRLYKEDPSLKTALLSDIQKQEASPQETPPAERSESIAADGEQDDISATLGAIRNRTQQIMEKWSTTVIQTRASAKTTTSKKSMRRNRFMS